MDNLNELLDSTYPQAMRSLELKLLVWRLEHDGFRLVEDGPRKSVYQKDGARVTVEIDQPG